MTVAASVLAAILRKPRIVLRLTAVTLIAFGPIAVVAWERHAALRLDPRYVEVQDPEAVARVAAYLERRHSGLDRLLPAGSGGTRFFQHLEDRAGVAFTAAATIGLAVTALDGGWPEAVEVHERGHLLHAALPAEAAALLSRVPSPAPGEYAATNAAEHFAEMASQAWELVSEPEGFCLFGDPLERLRDAEARVPGTAAFVAYFIRLLPASRPNSDAHGHGIDSAVLAAEARRLHAWYEDEWAALERGLAARRLAGGQLRPMEPLSIRARLQALRADLKSGGPVDRFVGAALLPSLAVLALSGR